MSGVHYVDRLLDVKLLPDGSMWRVDYACTAGGVLVPNATLSPRHLPIEFMDLMTQELIRRGQPEDLADLAKVIEFKRRQRLPDRAPAPHS